MARLNETREYQAERELGHTEVSRGTAWLVVVLFLLTLAGSLVIEIADGPPDFTALARSWPTGCSLSRFERELEDDALLGKALRPEVQALLLGLGAGNEQVIPGRDGWLFHRPGVDYVTGPGFLDEDVLRARRLAGDGCDPAPAPDPRPALVALQRDLSRRGIHLVVMPTPVKAVVQPARLSGRVPADTATQNPSYAAFADALADAGIDLFDPTPHLLGAEDYLVTDTHWRPASVERVAAELATHLRARVSGRDDGAPPRVEAAVRNRGDVAGMLGLPPGRRPPIEEVVVHGVAPTDAAPSVLLLGDSFSNIYADARAFASEEEGRELTWGSQAGLAEQLGFALRVPVERMARNAGGALASRADLVRALERGSDPLAGIDVVVYQFAMRELAQGDWQVLALPEPAAGAGPGGSDAAATTAPLRVRGTVASRSFVPRPGTVPYRDALFAVHLTEVEVQEGSLDASELVLYVMGLEDDRLTASADLAEGARREWSLVPWEAPGVQSRYGALNRSELDDLSLLSLPAFHAQEVPEE